MKKVYALSIFFLACILVNAQGTWIPKANFSAGRIVAVAFSIGAKGYVGTGGSYKRDFWEWDQATDTWTQKADFGGGARNSAIGFSIGAKGYIGTGIDSAGNYLKDFWEWDQATNAWTQKSNLGGAYVRLSAAGFSIGTKGYIGTGYGYPPAGTYLNDFWEWDQATDVWTQKANFGGSPRRMATCFSVGGKGYMGMGLDNSVNYIDMWEWDPASNSWSQKANFPGTLRWSYAFFATGTKGYVGLGNNSSTAYSDFWSFDPVANSWAPIANFPGILSMGTRSAFSISPKGYVLPGGNDKLWEYDTAVVCFDTVSFNGANSLMAGNVNFFTNTTTWITGTPSYTWKINGSTFATSTNSTYTFTVPGTFTVSLIGTNGQCADTAWKVITIVPNPNTNSWTQLANFPAAGRQHAVGFSIGSKGYVGTGYDYSSTQEFNDFWEYDTALNVWTQKANFGGIPRKGAVGFSIGTKGYIGTGSGGTFGPYYQDFWEWDQAANTWTQRANFGGASRHFATGFSIGSKGYIGTGTAGSPATMFSDFWEWDQASDTWVQKTGFVGAGRQLANGFSIGTKGYIGVGVGYYSGEEKQDFWEWDQGTDTWTQKSDFSGNARYGAIGFSIGTKGYIGTGINSSNIYFSDFHEWDQANNSWMPKVNFCGGGRYAGIGFSIGSKGFAGTGYIGWSITDFWEFDTICASSSSFNASATNVSTGTTVTFTNSSSGATSYTWQINGLTFATSNNASFVFNTCGSYTISLIASNCSCSDVSSQVITVTGTAWAQKANIGLERSDAVGFSIGNKGYIGTGYYDVITNFNDFWEWDRITNVWAQKASLPAQTRRSGSGFSIGTKGYIGFGTDGSVAYQDFWEWDQATNTWTQKATFPGTPRYEAVSFSIGSKGYIGTGALSFGNYLNDFWEWDQATNTWTAKAAFPGAVRYGAASFSLGTKGYIGTGSDDTNYFNDFWEWNQSTNTWVQKANFGGQGRSEAAGFSLGTNGFMATGHYWNNNQWNTTQDLWEWNQATDMWVQYNFLGTARFGAVAFSIGSWGYIGTGYDGVSANGNKKDLWEYAPCATPVTVNEENIENSFSIYPNPSNGKFILSSETTKGEIIIYNLQGKKVYVSQINSNKSEIDLSKQSSGIYFAKVQTEQGTAVKKLIINK